MTRFLSNSFALIFVLFAICGCAGSAIAQPEIAAAYLPLHGRVHLGLDSADGAAVVIAPNIAVTNAHNANLLDPKNVLGTRQDYDLLFFRTLKTASPPTGAPIIGQSVMAYGQGANRELRVAHGVVREIKDCSGCTVPAYFVFAGNAGPGFSGGPVLDGAGRLVGITFGYKDEGRQRLIYAYDMSRVQAELSAVQKLRN